jgi:hypothetical protein
VLGLLTKPDTSPKTGHPSALLFTIAIGIHTSSSWLNLIERWFRDLTQNRIRNDVFKSVAQLIDAIRRSVDHHDANQTSFV